MGGRGGGVDIWTSILLANMLKGGGGRGGGGFCGAGRGAAKAVVSGP